MSSSALVIYSAAEKQYCGALLAAFHGAYPDIRVDFRDGISTALHQRHVESVAAGASEADILWSSAMDLQLGLAHAGDALRHRSSEADALPSGAIYDDLAYATTFEPLVTLLNSELLHPQLPAGSLAEIAGVLHAERGRLAGKLACYDIERNGLGFLALMHESLHASGFDAFMQLLSEMKPRTFGSNPALVTEVASGRAALCFHVLASYAARAARDTPKLAIAVSATPPLAISRIALIPRTAPHPEAARCFVDFLLSRTGQRALQRAGFGPVRTDLDADARANDPALRPIRIDQGLGELIDPERRRAFLERWRRCVR